MTEPGFEQRRGPHTWGLMLYGRQLQILNYVLVELNCFVREGLWDSGMCAGGLEPGLTQGPTTRDGSQPPTPSSAQGTSPPAAEAGHGHGGQSPREYPIK